MSYVLHIWEKPADRPWPSTIDQATKLLKFLRSPEQPENPKFVEFARRLTSRYPDITSPEADEMPQSELAWSDGPMDGRCGSAVYAIGVQRALLDEVRPFVIEEANVLGLSVTDQQAAEVFFANGQVLALHARMQTPAPSQYDDVPKGRDLERLMFERLTPVMERHGFKARKTNRSFRQKFAGGHHSAHVYVEEHWLQCDLRLTVFSQMDAVSHLTTEILFPEKSAEERKNLVSDTMLGMHKWLDHACELVVPDSSRPDLALRVYRITSHKQIDAAVEHLVENMETRLFPILEKYKTIQGMDALLNTVPIEAAPFFVIPEWASRHIITAFLAGNPRLDAICDEFLSRVRDPTVRPHIVRCVEYVQHKRTRGEPSRFQ